MRTIDTLWEHCDCHYSYFIWCCFGWRCTTRPKNVKLDELLSMGMPIEIGADECASQNRSKNVHTTNNVDGKKRADEKKMTKYQSVTHSNNRNTRTDASLFISSVFYFPCLLRNSNLSIIRLMPEICVLLEFNDKNRILKFTLSIHCKTSTPNILWMNFVSIDVNVWVSACMWMVTNMEHMCWQLWHEWLINKANDFALHHFRIIANGMAITKT